MTYANILLIILIFIRIFVIMKKTLTNDEIKKKKEYHKVYREANKDKIKAWREVNKDNAKTYEKKRNKRDADKRKKSSAKSYQKYKTKRNENHKKYITKNKVAINIWHKNYLKDRKLTDLLFLTTCSIRRTITNSIARNGYSKKTKTYKILGCSFIEFKAHLESKFEPWMNWGNYGNPKDGIYELNKTWDIDHKVPLSTAITEEDVIKLNHYTNLQPMCSYTNRWIKKGGISS